MIPNQLRKSVVVVVNENACNEICIGARAFAVVDTYDAITSDRPYRKCRTYEVARAEIVKCAGSQFDPDVVQAWLRIPQAEWDAIRETVDVPG